jgi:hypothetical protein
MAQVVKIKDYISRYETNIYHYPGQFIRLKNENWKKVVHLWEMQGQKNNQREDAAQEEPNLLKWKRFFKRKEETDEVDIEEDKSIVHLPESKQQLKQYFLDTLLPFQLKWASTTISNMSFIDRSYEHNPDFKYFLQRFPDTYLIFYYPIFRLKNTPIDADILFVSPVGIEIIHLLDFKHKNIEIITKDDRTWYLEENRVQQRILSPMLSLKRTEQVVKSILNFHDIDFPITKVVLSRKHRMQFQMEPYHTRFVGSDEHEQWFQEKRKLVSPLKHQQLKVCEALLKHSLTTAVKRPEWEVDDDNELMNP